MTQVDPPVRRMLHHGAELVGATAGFALEYLAKVPPGSGGPVATLIAATLKKMASRTLSRQEQARIGAASAHAIDRISARLVAGHRLREWDFSISTVGERTPSAELFEAIVLKSRDVYEERKVRHIGLLFANVVFTQNVSFETANLLVRLLDRLTYRQLCIQLGIVLHELASLDQIPDEDVAPVDHMLEHLTAAFTVTQSQGQS